MVVVRTKIARLGIVIAVVGLAVLAASLFHWNRTTLSRGLIYSDDHYDWTIAALSSKPALEVDEVWDLPAACVKPFYLAQIQDFKGKLTAHNATKPPAVVLDPPKKNTQFATDPDFQRQLEGWDRRLQVLRRNSDAISQVAKAYGSYDTTTFNALNKALEDNDLAVDPLWVATRLRLSLLIEQWTLDADGVENKRSAKSYILNAVQHPSAINNISASIAISNAKTSEDRFDQAAQYLLGLVPFSSDMAKAIRLKCLEKTPIKRVLTDTVYGSDIGRWPLEMPGSFWIGIALSVLGLLLGPVVFWIRTADS